VGVISRAVEDCALALSVLAGADPVPPDDYAAAIADPPSPRIGVLAALVARATPEMGKHLELIMRGLEAGGARLVEVALPESFPALGEAGETVLRAEAAAAHAELYALHALEYPPRVKETIEQGRSVSAVQYLAAQETRRRAGRGLSDLASRHDALLAPTTAAPAPRGLHATGDPSFCAPFTFAGLPAIALPTGVDGVGLPLSVQLVGAAWAESRLLAAAAWCERVIDFDAGPPL
jgi:Asp-tRNA(Asn)/Glu-tRNA(Gln) amidotransferase A subunit family amidase